MVDLSNITSMYGDAYANAAGQAAEKLKNKLEGTDYSKAEDEELMAACKQFEAYFIEQMYKGMLKTIPESEETSNYTSSLMDFYKDEMMQSMAEKTAEQTDLGLARMLYEQMKRNYGTADIRTAQDSDAAQDAVSGQEETAGGKVPAV